MTNSVENNSNEPIIGYERLIFNNDDGNNNAANFPCSSIQPRMCLMLGLI